MRKPSYFSYWGKAKPIAEPSYHPLAYHSLDVAAVGRRYLERHPSLLKLFSQALSLSDEVALDWLTFFLSIHDLGKFAQAFQGQCPDALFDLQGIEAERPYGAIRHDTLGFLLWRDHLASRFAERSPFGDYSGEDSLESFHLCIHAVTGHHGQPPIEAQTIALANHFAPADIRAAESFVFDVSALFIHPESQHGWFSQDRDFESFSNILSWWLAGLVTLSDWLGSNQQYFPYSIDALALDAYWPVALKQADHALDAAQLLPVETAAAKDLGGLFGFDQSTPLQQQVMSMEWQSGPQLFILEDVTGAGKTEAAMLLTNRLLANGEARGFYVGLPTMATANAMYERLSNVYSGLFAGGNAASLVLAHSAARHSELFQQSVLPVEQQQEGGVETDATASARCSAWLSDNRKKALLAQAGVGTIDQALQAILPNKHQSLRLLGLFEKVLLVDEVHACDSYMHTLLQALLECHAMAGGSAILLSATLPQSMRAELLAAYAKGRRAACPALQSNGYPLLTHYHSDTQVAEQPLETRPTVQRQVAIEYVSDLDAVIQLLTQTTDQGGCICWIRNTVADALEAYTLLTEADFDVMVFHARFALGDRLDRESDVLASFGNKSGAVDRRAKVLIATQVVEQSLDLDFDVLISDLAPVDSLIQRAGRLQRHQRSSNGDLLGSGADQRESPVLWLYGPVLGSDPSAGWYSDFFPKAAYVYPDHGQLWLGADLLVAGQGFAMPGDARALIEGVYGEAAVEQIPEALQASHMEAQGGAKADQGNAQLNRLDIEAGYRTGTLIDWWRDALTPTRLGEATVPLLLLYWDEAEGKGEGEASLSPPKLRLWHRDAAHLSQVQVNAKFAAESYPSTDPNLIQAQESLLSDLPGEGRWLVPVVLTAKNERFYGKTLGQGERTVDWCYTHESGLVRLDTAAPETGE